MLVLPVATPIAIRTIQTIALAKLYAVAVLVFSRSLISLILLDHGVFATDTKSDAGKWSRVSRAQARNMLEVIVALSLGRVATF